jgi:hypothetical protein
MFDFSSWASVLWCLVQVETILFVQVIAAAIIVGTAKQLRQIRRAKRFAIAQHSTTIDDGSRDDSDDTPLELTRPASRELAGGVSAPGGVILPSGQYHRARIR